MTERCTRMYARMLPQPQRRAAHRGACLAVSALCLLAALVFAAGHSGTTSMHHGGHVLATAASGYELHGAGARVGHDVVPAARAAAQATAARLAGGLGAAPEPRGALLDTVRTRGPPATA